MIVIPLKRTDSASWADHLNPAISSVYGNASNFKSEIEAVEALRNAMAGAAPNESGRDLLFRYYSQLELLSLHVPVQTMKTTFTWHDLYSKHTESVESLAFEKCCVAFNLAASLSAVGAEYISKKDYKNAYHAFCCSAGVFHEISRSFVNCPSRDVYPETVTALSKVMQAEAQHSFYFKAVEAHKNPGLEAKLATGAIRLYESSLELLSSLYSQHKWGDKNFTKEIESNIHDLKGQAHIAQAAQTEKTHNYGLAIAHLNEAKHFISDKNEVQEINFRLKVLTKDNDLIYHERVPAVAPEIQGTSTVKLLSMSEIYPEEQAASIIGKDIFEHMVPISVHEKASLYSEMKAQHLRDQQEKSEIADLELTSALEYMNLPAAISDFKMKPIDSIEVPPEVLQWSYDVSTHPLDSIPTDFKDRRDRILRTLNASAASTHADVTGKTQSIKQSLVKSAQSDRALLELKETARRDIENLGKVSYLVNLFNNLTANPDNSASLSTQMNLLDLDDATTNSANGGNNLDEDLKAVSNLVVKLQKIKTERQNSLKELRTEMMADDGLNVLIAHQKDDNLVENVLQPELKKFDSKVRRIDATIRLQASVLENISSLWKQILESSEVKQRVDQQKTLALKVTELVESLQDVYKQYTTIKEGSGRAQVFYSNLEFEVGTSQGIPSQFSSDQSRPPTLPPKLPPKDSMSGYKTPSTYDRSMYH